MARTVLSDLVGTGSDQVADAPVDVIAYLPHFLERLTRGVVDLPVLDAA